MFFVNQTNHFFYRMHAPVMVELEGETDPLQLAMKELKYVFYLIYLLILNNGTPVKDFRYVNHS